VNNGRGRNGAEVMNEESVFGLGPVAGCGFGDSVTESMGEIWLPGRVATLKYGVVN
jgi:hypothetical protein